MSRLREKKRTVIYDEEEPSDIEESDFEAKEPKRARQVTSGATDTGTDGSPGHPEEGSKKSKPRFMSKRIPSYQARSGLIRFHLIKEVCSAADPLF